jgi:hypothetical protein
VEAELHDRALTSGRVPGAAAAGGLAMLREKRQRGEGRIGCLFWLTLLAIVVLVGFKMVPVKYRSSQFYDFMYEQAKYAQQTTPDDMKKTLLRKARELQLPVDPKRLTVAKRGGRIQIECSYEIPISFPLNYTYVWQFQEEINEPIFIW